LSGTPTKQKGPNKFKESLKKKEIEKGEATFTEKEKANRGNSTRLIKEQNRNEKCDLSNDAF